MRNENLNMVLNEISRILKNSVDEFIEIIEKNNEKGYMDDKLSKDIYLLHQMFYTIKYFIIIILISGLIGTELLAQEQKYIITAKSGLNLRIKPDIKSKLIVRIPAFQSVVLSEKTESKNVIEEKEGYWWKIKWFQNEGYAFSNYMELYSESLHKNLFSETILFKNATLYIDDQKK